MTLPVPFYEEVFTSTGELVVTSGGDPVVVATDPAQQHHRFIGAVLELELDWCLNTFGVAPCTATGTKCYQGFTTCKDKPNFRKTSHTFRFALRGMPAPAGETWRPYMTKVDPAASEIKAGSGLALRSLTTCTLIDETDNDSELDPYFATRASAPGGTFWRRLQARHLNAVGRPARLRRGFMTSPSSEAFFRTEHYIISSISGPDERGQVKVSLTDPIQKLDGAMVPAATDGKLAADLSAHVFAGTLAGATSTTVTFAPGAPVENGAFDGFEVYIIAGEGTGQRRVMSGYLGASLTATVAAWSVVPTSSSQFEVRVLSANVGSGKGEQYGASGYVRIGDEIIRFASRSGDVLAWPDGTYRGQFNTTAEDHGSGDGVQLCRVWQGSAASDVVLDLLAAGGVTDPLLDRAQIEAEDDTWLRGHTLITACLSKPEKVTQALDSLARDLGLMVYWHPIDQVVRARMNVPQISGADASYTDDAFIHGTVKIERKDPERLTRCAEYYGPRSATADTGEAKSYGIAEIRIDSDAESRNEYDDERADVQYSRWLTAANELHVRGLVARRLAAVRDAPYRFRFNLDPRESPDMGALVDCTSRKLTDAEGNPRTVRARVVKLSNEGYHWEVEAQSTTFGGKRYAFIAPNGQANFGSATAAEKQYAYICGSNGLMSDGTQPYLII